MKGMRIPMGLLAGLVFGLAGILLTELAAAENIARQGVLLARATVGF
jgi:hypothetical protein